MTKSLTVFICLLARMAPVPWGCLVGAGYPDNIFLFILVLLSLGMSVATYISQMEKPRLWNPSYRSTVGPGRTENPSTVDFKLSLVPFEAQDSLGEKKMRKTATGKNVNMVTKETEEPIFLDEELDTWYSGWHLPVG